MGKSKDKEKTENSTDEELSDADLENVAAGSAAEAGMRNRAMQENLPDLTPEGQAFIDSLSPAQKETLTKWKA